MCQLRAQTLDGCERVRKCSLGSRSSRLLGPQGRLCLRQLLRVRRWLATSVSTSIQEDHRDLAVFDKAPRAVVSVYPV
jgi:hypothetical protein